MAMCAIGRWLYCGRRPNWIARLINRADAAVTSTGVTARLGAVTLELTLRRGYSPADARFSDAANATPPRRLCPSRSMFFAALWSRCRLVPQPGHECQRTDRPFWTRTPQPEHVWLVYAGGTPTARFPAHTALKARMLKKPLQPASLILLARW
jgi:hypothetical protein